MIFHGILEYHGFREPWLVHSQDGSVVDVRPVMAASMALMHGQRVRDHVGYSLVGAFVDQRVSRVFEFCNEGEAFGLFVNEPVGMEGRNLGAFLEDTFQFLNGTRIKVACQEDGFLVMAMPDDVPQIERPLKGTRGNSIPVDGECIRTLCQPDGQEPCMFYRVGSRSGPLCLKFDPAACRSLLYYANEEGRKGRLGNCRVYVRQPVWWSGHPLGFYRSH